jgi:hypothetical protein
MTCAVAMRMSSQVSRILPRSIVQVIFSRALIGSRSSPIPRRDSGANCGASTARPMQCISAPPATCFSQSRNCVTLPSRS